MSLVLPEIAAPSPPIYSIIDRLKHWWWPQTKQQENIAIIGFHGWYPQVKIVQTVFGEQLGTSELLCQKAQEALGQECLLIPLTNRGMTIRQRVEASIEELEQKDFSGITKIQLVAHSQGCIVSVLVAKHLRQLFSDLKISILCLAGIMHGPHPQLKQNLVVQYVETAAARELFEFCDADVNFEPSDSVVNEYWMALKYILESRVTIHCVASWSDQVVPLYSGLLWAVDHPNISRQVFVSERLQVDLDGYFLIDFILYMVKLRNSGHSDHNLLPYMILACPDVFNGDLYGGYEHASVYEEQMVYNSGLTVDIPLDNRQVKLNPFRTDRHESETAPFSSPYLISYSIKALMQEQDLSKFMERYQQWNPMTKQELKLKRYMVAFDAELKRSKL